MNRRTLPQLRQAQAQLVQSEKMAFPGELTAGIAHELPSPPAKAPGWASRRPTTS